MKNHAYANMAGNQSNFSVELEQHRAASWSVFWKGGETFFSDNGGDEILWCHETLAPGKKIFKNLEMALSESS